jgi:regulatory protein
MARIVEIALLDGDCGIPMIRQRFASFRDSVRMCASMRRATASKKQLKLTPEEMRKRTFERAVKLLAAKPRSVSELRERLLQGRGTSKSAVDEVVERLREYGYLDDEKFAFSYAALKIKQRPVGRRRLEQDLKFKKVDKQVAEDALELVYAETSEDDLIDRAIEKRLRVRGRPSNRTEAKSLFDYLLRLGFEYELVSDKIRGLLSDDADT